MNSTRISKLFQLILGPSLFFLIRFYFYPEGLSNEANAILAATIWIAIWWIGEVIPMAVTALLPNRIVSVIWWNGFNKHYGSLWT